MNIDLTQVSKVAVVAFILTTDALLFIALVLRGQPSWRSKLLGALSATVLLGVLLIANALVLSTVLIDVPGLAAFATTLLAILAIAALLSPPTSQARLIAFVVAGLLLYVAAFSDNGLAIAAAARGQPLTAVFGVAMAAPVLLLELMLVVLLFGEFKWKRVLLVVVALLVGATVFTKGLTFGPVVAVPTLLLEALGLPALSWAAALIFVFLAAEAIYTFGPTKAAIAPLGVSQLVFQCGVTVLAFVLTLALHFRKKQKSPAASDGTAPSRA